MNDRDCLCGLKDDLLFDGFVGMWIFVFNLQEFGWASECASKWFSGGIHDEGGVDRFVFDGTVDGFECG